MYDTYLVIAGEDTIEQPTLVGKNTRERGRFYLIRRNHQLYCPQHVHTLKRYRGRDFADEHAVEQLFYVEFPPVPRIVQAPGWLAPDGKFFPCHYLEHDRIAHALARIYHGTRHYVGSAFLEDHNWLHIASTGECAFLPDMDTINVTQIDTIYALIELAPKSMYANNMRRLLRLICEFQSAS